VTPIAIDVRRRNFVHLRNGLGQHAQAFRSRPPLLDAPGHPPRVGDEQARSTGVHPHEHHGDLLAIGPRQASAQLAQRHEARRQPRQDLGLQRQRQDAAHQRDHSHGNRGARQLEFQHVVRRRRNRHQMEPFHLRLGIPRQPHSCSSAGAACHRKMVKAGDPWRPASRRKPSTAAPGVAYPRKRVPDPKE